MGVNSLPKTVTRQRRDCDLNPGSPESSMLTTRLPSHSRDWRNYCNYPLVAVLVGDVEPVIGIETVGDQERRHPFIAVAAALA